MEYVYGVLSAASFFIAITAAFSLGKLQAKKTATKQPTPQPIEVDEEQLEKAKRIQAHFENLMSYDVEQAMKREW